MYPIAMRKHDKIQSQIKYNAKFDKMQENPE
jgi:hypothetical protein